MICCSFTKKLVILGIKFSVSLTVVSKSVFLFKLLAPGILSSTSLILIPPKNCVTTFLYILFSASVILVFNLDVVNNPEILGILFSSSFMLVLNTDLLTKAVILGILFSMFVIFLL